MRFPKDENGDVLRRMHKAGMDLLAEHNIDFCHLFSTKSKANAMARRCRKIGVNAVVEENDVVGGWDVRCIVSMVPTHAAITETELKLGQIAEQCGGEADGWGVLQE